MIDQCLAAALLMLLPSDGPVTSPDEHLGRPLGVDFELASWDEVSSYFWKLSEESPRVLTENVGTTTEGRDFLVSVITDEENMGRLDEIREDAHHVSDPRNLTEKDRSRILTEGKVTLFISIAMHSTETAAPQFGMKFAYKLATSDEEPYVSARKKLVVIIAPCLNPDGLDHVVSWYRSTVGTPYEGSDLLQLYQLYTGHDNNRDWFMLSQKETQIVTRLLYSVWRPQVYWDVHQQGQSRERMFVPPFRDPLNPNLDASIIAGIDVLGSRALLDMTNEGYSGVSTGVTYDMWWNGGNRNVPVRHNMIGLLTEAASVNLASPVFLAPGKLSAPRGIEGGYAPSNRFPKPWPGGWWRLGDIIDYEMAFGKSLLGSLAREPETWLENSLGAATRSLQSASTSSPRAWVLPATNRDLGASRRLASILLDGGVELSVAQSEFEADGRRWPKGSIVISRNQPYSNFVKDLFEVQHYPDGDPPYDVAGWTLPLLLGVHRVEVVDDFKVDLVAVNDADEAVAEFGHATPGGTLDMRNSESWNELFRRTTGGQTFGLEISEGTPLLRERPADDEGASSSFEQVKRTPVVAGPMPRVGLYAPWSGNMQEGWMRFVFDSFGLPYTRIRNEMIRAGNLGDIIDVLVLPGISARQLNSGRRKGTVEDRFAGGLDPEGSVAIEEFIRNGGRLVAIGQSALWSIDLLKLPIEDVARGSEQFSCPGSVLRAIPTDEPLAAGLPESMALFFSRSSAFSVNDGGGSGSITTLLRYAPTRLLLSGWIKGSEVIEGKAAWLRARYGEGTVDLFAFPPHYRSWSQGTFHLVFRAILFQSETSG